ncbi:hypothetical protein GE061_007122 [Apolygus lucorum]|uniref:Uncharacterized protein n=1 Tax=Apolygus lucorum TaxID=248454 RepID=A0A6A4IQX5_APOLU|nr:hypothetical protein GE061_007122 [Apolygus lucorum]
MDVRSLTWLLLATSVIMCNGETSMLNSLEGLGLLKLCHKVHGGCGPDPQFISGTFTSDEDTKTWDIVFKNGSKDCTVRIRTNKIPGNEHLRIGPIAQCE